MCHVLYGHIKMTLYYCFDSVPSHINVRRLNLPFSSVLHETNDHFLQVFKFEFTMFESFTYK